MRNHIWRMGVLIQLERIDINQLLKLLLLNTKRYLYKKEIMKTKLILLSAGIIFTSVSFAQTLQEAITKTDNERYAAAAADFRALIAKEAAKGDNYFYYGENFFKKGDLDSANMYYQKGVEVNATYPLNYVGLGKVLWYNGKTADAKTQLFKAKNKCALCDNHSISDHTFKLNLINYYGFDFIQKHILTTSIYHFQSIQFLSNRGPPKQKTFTT